MVGHPIQKRFLQFTTALCVLGMPVTAQAVIIYVDDSATGTNVGIDWTNAYVNLQDALAAAAPGDQIFVAEGTYTTQGAVCSRLISFELKPGVALYGGFEGGLNGASTLAEREGLFDSTILSGDLNGDDESGNYDDNSYHVVRADGVDNSSVLDGFTIRGGNADDPLDGKGAGLLISSGSPTIRNCTFKDNTAYNAGGAISHFGDPIILARCTFVGNKGVDIGGALYVELGKTVSLEHCRFFGNRADLDGGAVYNNGSVEFKGCLFSGNSAGVNGGAVYSQGTETTFVSCTLAQNSADNGADGLFANSIIDEIRNSIFWENGGANAVQDDQISGSVTAINYSCVQGWTGTLGGTGNIGDDPLFKDADGADNTIGTVDDDVHLDDDPFSFSPCINTGDDSENELAHDVDGDQRVRHCQIDMGVDETAAFNDDCIGNGISDLCEVNKGEPNFAGRPDNFTEPFDEATPGPELNELLTCTSGARQFDDYLATDRCFGHTLNFIPSGVIIAAQLEISLKTRVIGTVAQNDSIDLQVNNNMFVWSQYIDDLVPGGWGDSEAIVVLDLGALPPDGNGITDILQHLQNDGRLDVRVQDDTGVDYIRLELFYESSDCNSNLIPDDCDTFVDITEGPKDAAVSVGDPVTFSVVATGNNLSYQWKKKNEVTSEFEDIIGEISDSFTIASATEDDSGDYRVVVSTVCGERMEEATSDAKLVVSDDCNANMVPDPCDIDCEAPGCSGYANCGDSEDCQQNLFPDECDINLGLSLDCDGNGEPDECHAGALDCALNTCDFQWTGAEDGIAFDKGGNWNYTYTMGSGSGFVPGGNAFLDTGAISSELDVALSDICTLSIGGDFSGLQTLAVKSGITLAPDRVDVEPYGQLQGEDASTLDAGTLFIHDGGLNDGKLIVAENSAFGVTSSDITQQGTVELAAGATLTFEKTFDNEGLIKAWNDSTLVLSETVNNTTGDIDLEHASVEITSQKLENGLALGQTRSLITTKGNVEIKVDELFNQAATADGDVPRIQVLRDNDGDFTRVHGDLINNNSYVSIADGATLVVDAYRSDGGTLAGQGNLSECDVECIDACDCPAYCECPDDCLTNTSCSDPCSECIPSSGGNAPLAASDHTFEAINNLTLSAESRVEMSDGHLIVGGNVDIAVDMSGSGQFSVGTLELNGAVLQEVEALSPNAGDRPGSAEQIPFAIDELVVGAESEVVFVDNHNNGGGNGDVVYANTVTVGTGSVDLAGGTLYYNAIDNPGNITNGAVEQFFFDCNGNDIPDECDIDCNHPDCADWQGVCGQNDDCDLDGIPDACQIVLHVDQSAAAPGDGLSWSSAFPDLQDALAKAAGSSCTVQEIWVAEGTYTPTGPDGDREATFELLDGVALYGGFDGSETSLEQRESHLHATVLSGDLNKNDGPLFDNIGENSHHVLTFNSPGGLAILDGFHIVAGNADGPASASNGGGLLLLAGSVDIRYCQFRGNTAADHGGAIYNGSSTPVRCDPLPKLQQPTGGICEQGDPVSAYLINCLFWRNNANALGGAIHQDWNSRMSITNCTVVDNTANRGGGIFGRAHLWIDNVILWANSDSRGSGEAAQITAERIPPIVSYSTIQGLTGSLGGVGNIDLDPNFSDQVLGDLRLLPGSPCIDAGDGDAIPDEIVTDLNGQPRVIDDLLTPNSGAGAPVDMGAYEYCTHNDARCTGDGLPFQVENAGDGPSNGGSIEPPN